MTKPVKKLLFIGQLPPPIHGAGAMNRYVVNSPLIKSNFKVEVINLQFAHSVKSISKFSFRKIVKSLYYLGQIIQKVSLGRPDLVYFTISPTGFAFYRDAIYVFILKLFRRHLIFHLHSKGVKKSVKNSPLKLALYKWVFKHSEIICISENLIEDVALVYHNKPFIVPNGIQLHEPVSLNGNAPPKNQPRILFLSNFLKEKGLMVFLESLSILQSKGFQFQATLVGAEADYSIDEILKYVRQNGLTEKVQVLGPLYGEDKFKEFQKADIFVFPSFNEAFGLVNLEAMLYSLPVVSTTEGGIPDVVIDNETGFLVETKKPLMLAEKIGVLLKDEHLRLKMGQNGYERLINNFTLQHFEENICNTLLEIISKKNNKSSNGE